MLQQPTNSFYTSVGILEMLSGGFSDINNLIFKEIFDFHVYDSIPEMIIKQGDVVLDVGAHIGIFSRYASVCGADKIIAFEMNPKLFSCLKLNVRNQDDVFNCVLLDKNLSKFKLENDILVNGFDLNHFYEGKLFDHINFMKVDIVGKEVELLVSIHKKVYEVIDRISIRYYNMPDNKSSLVEFMKMNGFNRFHNLLITDQPFQFLYFWK